MKKKDCNYFSVTVLVRLSSGQLFESIFSLTFALCDESRQLSVFPGVGMKNCGYIGRKDLDTAR